MKKALATATFK